jgi:glycosyltransferase involved in cell wall biosynthesis
MAAAAVELLRDPARRCAMGKASRQRVIERFSAEKVVPLYEACYQAATR